MTESNSVVLSSYDFGIQPFSFAMVIGTIVGTKEYSNYSTAFSDQFSNLMPTMQAMSDSFQVQ